MSAYLRLRGSLGSGPGVLGVRWRWRSVCISHLTGDGRQSGCKKSILRELRHSGAALGANSLEAVSSHGLVQSGMELLTFRTAGLLRDPVRHVGDWEGVRPRPRPMPAGRGPDGADGRLTVDEAGNEERCSPLMAGIITTLSVATAPGDDSTSS